MVSSGSRELVFGSSSGLEAYSLSFYNQLPSLSDLTSAEGTSADYIVAKSINSFYTEGYSAESNTSWGWGNLRNINFLIDGIHSDDCTVPQEDKDHYEGIARWFRARFYLGKLQTYGGVPWFDHCLNSTELDEMYKNRDSRDVIISHIIEDLDFAAEHITTTSSTGNTRISKNAAYALKSRACLFEASWRKYHNEETTEWTATKLFREAADAASRVMADNSVNLNSRRCDDAYLDDNPSLGAYRSLFYSKKMMTDEVILGVQASLDELVTGSANWYYNSATYGDCLCLSRALIFTYLCKDGTRFTDKSRYQAISFINEFTDRDERLAQTVKGPHYQINGGNWKDRRPDIVNGTAVTGYQPIKFVEDDVSKNGTNKNENSQPIIRYAEVLLNYAEAKAELGELSDADWSNTIGALRRRAGIQEKPGVTSSKPTTVDNYLQQTFYPDINDPVILEIRRERTLELVLEGFRVDDLNRWKEGECFERVPMTGLHVPSLNAQFSVNDDDTKDFYVTYDDYADVPSYAQNKYVHVLPEDSPEQGLRVDENPDGGYDLRYVLAIPRKWHDDDRQYLHPIPPLVVREYASRGYKLDQNPGW
ncbi:MAG: RagB/SusD family nutrient uptake outer membrane protein [Bacteroidales bacterium]|nr:RagB/SusD family nutrient uptake outer membrane protein [Bacteroidales bacterium]